MAQLIKGPVIYSGGIISDAKEARISDVLLSESKKRTITYNILKAHNTSGNDTGLKLRFDSLASHDITYVGIVQTARASGMKEFPMRYILTNCHNSLCAVGGTINEDDHLFGLSAAKKYGGDFVPAHQAVIHQYVREMTAGCGRMILGSDSHTRYGALGTMAIGEGGPELVKQLLNRTYDIRYPEVVLVYLEGTPGHGVGPQDIALELIAAVFENGFVKNKVLEFAGPGIAGLSVDFRNGIDVMTTEAACLSTIWQTDGKVREYYRIHGRENDYKMLSPADGAVYDACIKIDLSASEPMIALPFHPSNVFSIKDFNQNMRDIVRKTEEEAVRLFGAGAGFTLEDKIKDGGFYAGQAVIGGCSGGTYENIALAANILKDGSTGTGDFWLSIYPASQPVFMRLNRTGAIADLASAGASIRTAFCGPCFGAGDVPANNTLSIRHNTRNFPNREGSKPGQGQIASVALMDSRSIAATAINGGRLTSAADIDYDETILPYEFDEKVYRNRVYYGFGKPQHDVELKFGPNIIDWPEMKPLCEDIVLVTASVINDPVTTTDELIPSGETSAYRSNPMKLAEYALSRKDPGYVARAKNIAADRLGILEKLGIAADSDTCVGSVIFAVSPGDGSAREQAASVQKVLGGWANISIEYATKRYRSNLINWGIIPFTTGPENKTLFVTGDVVYVKGIASAIREGREEIGAEVIKADGSKVMITLKTGPLTTDERAIILDGCLINYYKNGR